jgi:arabinogalactan endo-1,4-beta-galactosidase
MQLKIILNIVLFCCCFTVKGQQKKLAWKWNEFVIGADMSYVNEIEDAGGVYLMNGRKEDPFRIMKSIGVNTVRVRLWHSSEWKKQLNSKGKVYSDLYDVEKTIRRAKEAGMAVNLDLHYSDTWADPAHQSTPAAWVSLPFEVLKDSVYHYTFSVLEYLKGRSLVPELIQIGNETNSGMLWPIGKTDDATGWQQYAALVNSGIKAVKDFSANSIIKPQIILHVAQLQHAQDWVKNLVQNGVVDFDIIGLSHYYPWSNYKTMKSTGDKIDSLQTAYHKKVMIVETAFPFTNNNSDTHTNILILNNKLENRYDATENGQVAYITDLIKTVKQNKGSGVMYWEPAWISSPMKDLWSTGSAWENAAWFDFKGNLLKGIRFYKR